MPDVATAHLRAEYASDDALAALAGSRGTVTLATSQALRMRTNVGLVTMLGVGAGTVPRGIGVVAPPDFRAIGLRSGDPVSLHRTRVVVGRGEVSVETAAAHGVSTLLPRAEGLRPTETALRAADRVLAQAPTGRGLAGLLHGDVDAGPGVRVGDAGDPVGRRREDGRAAAEAFPSNARFALAAARRVMPALDSALRAGAPQGASAARPLLGLGEGLTPSGDDILIGIAAMLRAWGSPTAAFARRWAAEASDRTTAVSADLLAHAADGRFAEVLQDVVRALDGDDDGVPTRRACHRLLAVGATSGADLLTGLLIGGAVLTEATPMLIGAC